MLTEFSTSAVQKMHASTLLLFCYAKAIDREDDFDAETYSLADFQFCCD